MTEERCLSDAGMPPEQIEAVIACLQADRGKEAAAVLKGWRAELLDQLHACQKRIDCLDYFLQEHKKALLEMKQTT